jgi:subtilisin family serine protease
MEGIRGLRPNAAVLDEDVNKGSHGTKMAIIAAGKDSGVAPNANLYLVKAKGSYLNDADGPVDDFRIYPAYQVGAVRFALNHIRSVIQAKLNANSNEKSVINMSWGKSSLASCTDQRLTTI